MPERYRQEEKMVNEEERKRMKNNIMSKQIRGKTLHSDQTPTIRRLRQDLSWSAG